MGSAYNPTYYNSPQQQQQQQQQPQPPIANPQSNTRQLLNGILEQRGPGALPYNEGDKWLIREQLAFTIQTFSGLQVRPATFTHNDGRQVQLLQLEGTVPMWYKEVKYNIPVTVWLLEQFPRAAPLVYVTPTRDMIIRPNHSHVNASGLVDVPFLREWVYQRSTLVDLLQVLSVTFGQEPPLYSRTPAHSAARAGGDAGDARGHQQHPQQQQQQHPQQQQRQQHPHHHPQHPQQQQQQMSPQPQVFSGGVAPTPLSPSSAFQGTNPMHMHGAPSPAVEPSRIGASGSGGRERAVSGSGSGGGGGGVVAGGVGMYAHGQQQQQHQHQQQPQQQQQYGQSKGVYTGASSGPGLGGPGAGGAGAAAAGGAAGAAGGMAAAGGRDTKQNSAEEAKEVFRKAAVASLSFQLNADLNESWQQANRLMEEQLGLQQMLAARKEQASGVVRELAREKQALEETLQVQQTNADVIESWLVQNATSTTTTTTTTTTTSRGDAAAVDIDSAFQPCDALSAQLLKHTAADLAIEDVLYSLDRALQEERGHDESYDPSSAGSRRRILTVDAYLRHVRSLAKEQFFQRATALKVQAVQRSARVGQLADRPVSAHVLSSAAAAASSAAAAAAAAGMGGGSGTRGY